MLCLCSNSFTLSYPSLFLSNTLNFCADRTSEICPVQWRWRRLSILCLISFSLIHTYCMSLYIMRILQELEKTSWTYSITYTKTHTHTDLPFVETELLNLPCSIVLKASIFSSCAKMFLPPPPSHLFLYHTYKVHTNTHTLTFRLCRKSFLNLPCSIFVKASYTTASIRFIRKYRLIADIKNYLFSCQDFQKKC